MTVVIRTGLGETEQAAVTVTGLGDLTGAVFQMALGTWDAPGDWRPTDTAVITGQSAVIGVTIGQGHYDPAAGAYWLWWRRADTPAAVARSALTRYVIDTDGGISVGAAAGTSIYDGGVV